MWKVIGNIIAIALAIAILNRVIKKKNSNNGEKKCETTNKQNKKIATIRPRQITDTSNDTPQLNEAIDRETVIRLFLENLRITQGDDERFRQEEQRIWNRYETLRNRNELDEDNSSESAESEIDGGITRMSVRRRLRQMVNEQNEQTEENQTDQPETEPSEPTGANETNQQTNESIEQRVINLIDPPIEEDW